MRRDIDKVLQDVAQNGATSPRDLDAAFHTARGRLEKANHVQAEVTTQLLRAVTDLTQMVVVSRAKIASLEQRIRALEAGS